MALLVTIIAWLCGCVVGMALMSLHPAGLNPGYGVGVAALGALAVAPTLLVRKHVPSFLVCVAVVGFLLGSGRTLITHMPVTPLDLAYYNKEEGSARVLVTGVISEEPQLRDRSQRVRLKARSVRLAPVSSQSVGSRQNQPLATDFAVSGDMYAILPRYPIYSAGEQLALDGELTAPPVFPGFDYRAYLSRQGVYSYMLFPRVVSLGPSEADSSILRSIQAARSQVRGTLNSAISEPQAAIAVSVVTGDRSAIPVAVEEAFRRTGTSHILAISGQNITLLVGCIWLVYRGRSRRGRMPVGLLLAVLAGLAFYTIFTGANPPVARAAAMGAIFLMAPALGRRPDALAALALSAFVITLVDPDAVADGGFQLTYAAMLGLAFIAPQLHALFQRMKLPALLSVPLAASLGAQTATTPIIALLTGEVSLISPAATLSADAALLPLMVTGIVTGIVGGISQTLASVVGLSVWPFAWWLVASAESWAALPWASVSAETVTTTTAALYYLSLALLLVLPRRLTAGKLRAMIASQPLLFSLTVCAAILWGLLCWLLTL